MTDRSSMLLTLRPQRVSGRGLTTALLDEKRHCRLTQPLEKASQPTRAQRQAMKGVKVAVAYDTWGRQLGPYVTQTLAGWGVSAVDHSALLFTEHEDVPYATCALPAMLALSRRDADRAVLIGANGIGMFDVAQLWPGTLPTLATSAYAVEDGNRAHDNNVLCLGARLLQGDRLLCDLFLKNFMCTAYEGLEPFYKDQARQANTWARRARNKGRRVSQKDFADVAKRYPSLFAASGSTSKAASGPKA